MGGKFLRRLTDGPRAESAHSSESCQAPPTVRKIDVPCIGSVNRYSEPHFTSKSLFGANVRSPSACRPVDASRFREPRPPVRITPGDSLVGFGAAGGCLGRGLDGRGEVIGRRLSVTAGNTFERHFLTFAQRGKAGPLDGADVNEHVPGAILRVDESVTPNGIEPLDDTSNPDPFLPRRFLHSSAPRGASRRRSPFRRKKPAGRACSDDPASRH